MLFETKTPLFHKLCDKQLICFRNSLSCFVKPETLLSTGVQSLTKTLVVQAIKRNHQSCFVTPDTLLSTGVQSLTKTLVVQAIKQNHQSCFVTPDTLLSTGVQSLTKTLVVQAIKQNHQTNLLRYTNYWSMRRLQIVLQGDTAAPLKRRKRLPILV